MQKLTWIIIISLAGSCSTIHGQTVVKAKVEEPVLQELMGGCSLKCAFAWGVEVQVPGARPAALKVLNDDNAESAWIVSDGASGKGVKFKFLFPKKLTAELQDTPLYGLDLINGVWKSEEIWKAHGRVKKARLYYNDKPFLDVVFADSRRWQRLSFPDIFVHSGDSMTFEILEVYPGTNGSGAAITEIVLQGAH
ncbi:MAG: hypothetical protein ACAI37_06890 [Chthoniobacter sp.]